MDGFSEAFTTVADPDLLMYQVSLERSGDRIESQWDLSSVKMCHHYFATSEFVYLHTLDSDATTPHAIDYFISPVPHNGACPKSKPKSFQTLARNVNTTVILKSPSLPPLPSLKTPPPLSTEGEPIAPIPEKTFLQKYWIYIVGFLLVTLITGGGPEEGQKKRE